MERKIGEIFEYNGEWYQCLEEKTCTCFGCDFRNYNCDDISLQRVKGSCQSERRKDNKSVIFKKLEKVGEPYADYSPSGRVIYFQRYKCYQKPIDTGDIIYWADDIHISIEIKQNKEDMEEEREYTEDEFKNSPRFQHHKPIEQVINMKKMKPFDLEAAKAGKPVCTRDGRKARIVCFDAKGCYPIIALTAELDNTEDITKCTEEGISSYHKNDDLMMLPGKKEGWINIYKKSNGECYFAHIYDTKALAEIGKDAGCIATVRIEWEE